MYPSVPKSEACGKCINCLNPLRKQACMVRRQEMQALMDEQRESAQQSMEPDAAPGQPVP